MIDRVTSRPDNQSMRPGGRVVHRLRGCSLSAIIFLSAACRQSGSTEVEKGGMRSDPVAIQIGGRGVRISELQAEIDHLASKRHPAAANLDAFLTPALERLVALEKARELGLDKDPGFRRQFENLLIGRLRESEIEARLRATTVTDAEIQDHFQRNRRLYSRPAQLQLALLFLSVPSNADDKTRATVRRRMEEARAIALELPENTRGFGEHAMSYSEEATSRFKGGDIGWLEAGDSACRWPDAVVKSGFALRNNGDVSEIIDTPEGFYLLKKLDAREPAVRSLDGRFRATLETSLLKEKRVSIETGLKEEWKESLNVIIHNEVLGSLQFQSPEDPAGTAGDLPAGP